MIVPSKYSHIEIEPTPLRKEDHDYIDYRKITKEDFLLDNVLKVEIQADENGYVKDALLNEIDNKPDLTVINIGTGQGKSTAIIEKIRDYYLDEAGYMIVIASPTKALVNKYYMEVTETLKDVITQDNVVDYRQIAGNENFTFNDNHRILVATINLLLGNPGEDGFYQSGEKVDYLESFRQYCRDHQKKVIIIFDEIHEGVQNFQPELYPNILTWMEITQKVLVLSATYSEPAIVVLRMLASLTDSKVKIIESKRIKMGVQANLYLLFVNKKYSTDYVAPLNVLEKPIKDAVRKNKKVNILSYSKTIADKIKKNNKKLSAIFQGANELNLVTSESGNTYDPNKNNIGTTFRSGVNINDPDNLFIIILPSSQGTASDGMRSQKFSGIFTSGAHEIIQAVARVRNGGDIYIVAPNPDYLIDGNYFEANKTEFPFNRIDEEDKAEYFQCSDHITKLSLYYSKRRNKIEAEIKHMDDQRTSPDKPNIHYPSFDEFLLKDGQRFLTLYHEICGYRVIPYAVWAAYNDQFPNCKLKGIVYRDIKFELNAKTIIEDFINCFKDNYSTVDDPSDRSIQISKIERFIEMSNDQDGLDYLIRELKDSNVTLNKRDVADIEGNEKINIALMQLIRAIKIDGSKLHNEFALIDYLSHNLAIVSATEENSVHQSELELYLTYKNLAKIVDLFNHAISGVQLLHDRFSTFTDSEFDLSSELLVDLKNVVDELRSKDEYARKAFDLKLNYNDDSEPLEKKKEAYDFLINNFLELGQMKRKRRFQNGEMVRQFKASDDFSVLQLPDPNHCLNFNFPNSFKRNPNYADLLKGFQLKGERVISKAPPKEFFPDLDDLLPDFSWLSQL